MKELSIVKRIVKQMVADGQISQEVAEKYFPELKESEDEKIRKCLLSHFSRYQEEEVFLNNIKMGDIIAWLEKQGEIVKYYEDKLDRCACKSFNKGYKAALEKQGEKGTNGNERGIPNSKQNPAWSEEDEKVIDKIESELLALYRGDYHNIDFNDVSTKDALKWVIELKHRQRHLKNC